MISLQIAAREDIQNLLLHDTVAKTGSSLALELLTKAANLRQAVTETAGCCWVMQWMLPPPSRISLVDTPTTLRSGNVSLNTSSALQTAHSSSAQPLSWQLYHKRISLTMTSMPCSNPDGLHDAIAKSDAILAWNAQLHASDTAVQST